MKLSELISKYGDDKVAIQYLDKCAIDLNYDHKKGTTIKFGTDVNIGLNGTELLGIIVWLDRDRVKEIIGEENPNDRPHE